MADPTLTQDDLVAAIQDVDPDGVIAQHGPFVLTKTGALATGDPTFEQWEAALQWCQRVEQYSPFWIGDLIAFGEARYGEMYAQAMDVTAQKYGSLANAVYVAKAVPPDRRRTGLGFAVHRAVAPLPPDEQEQWLDKAESDELTENQLRHEIKVAKSTEAGTELDCWLVVHCTNLQDQSDLAMRMQQEGRAVKYQTKPI